MKSKQSSLVKPLLRGHFHQAAFFIALGACALLIAQVQRQELFTSIILYSLSLCGLLGTSALYHRIHWEPKSRMWMRRLDHSFIFFLIAGTATPICLLSLSPVDSARVLTILWVSAGFGVAQSLFWVKAPKWVSAIIYVGLGWMTVPHLGAFRATLGLTKVIEILVGGALYTLGAVVYALRYPDPWPKYFGYHEIFHLFVVAAAFFHFLVIYAIVAFP